MSGADNPRRHNRDDVARIALRILDDFGLPDLTMRRLAAALDVQPSALYWHYPNKQALLAELANRIVSPPSSGRPDQPRGVRDEAAALRDSLLAYRDGAEVVSSTLALGLGPDAPGTRLAEAIVTDGFDELTARRAAQTLLHFVLGHVSHEQQRMQYDSLGVLAASAGSTGSPAASDSSASSTSEHDDSSTEFAFGVDLLVNGLEYSRSRR